MTRTRMEIRAVFVGGVERRTVPDKLQLIIITIAGQRYRGYDEAYDEIK